jgi:hypothetical protein
MTTEGRTRQLRNALHDVLGGNPSHAPLAFVVEHSRRWALAYLRTASQRVTGVFQRLGMSPEDAAYDVIAELFSRDQKGSFHVLQRWWNNLRPNDRSTDEALEQAFRRLVVGAVHQRAFQSYRDSDPHLAKIIRNIKLALKKHPTVRQILDQDFPALIARHCKSSRSHLPQMPSEVLLPQLYDLTMPRASLSRMLDSLGEILSSQMEYRRILPVVQAALLIREVYLSDACRADGSEYATGFSESDVEGMVGEALECVRRSALANYLNKRKLSEDELQAHSAALELIMRSYYLDGRTKNGADGTFYASLKKHLPGLTQENFRRKHRMILEYLVKQTTRHLRIAIQKELGKV